jgi:20S proteasome subunit beta 1
MERGTPGMIDVKTAAQLVMQMAYSNKSALQAGMIVAGWDAREGGVVYGVPLGGTLIQVPFTLGGSGSTYIYGWVDHTYRAGMSRGETEAFVTRAVSLAMARDGSSGGVIRMVTIDAKGATRTLIPGHQVPLGHDELQGSAA